MSGDFGGGGGWAEAGDVGILTRRRGGIQKQKFLSPRAPRLRVSIIKLRPLLYHHVKDRLEQPVLDDAVFRELALGVGLRQFRRDFPCVLKDFPVPELEAPTQALFPVFHGHRDLSHLRVYREVRGGGPCA